MQDIKKWTLPFEKRCVKMVLRWRERKTTRKLPKYLEQVEKQGIYGIDKVKNGKESNKWSKKYEGDGLQARSVKRVHWKKECSIYKGLKAFRQTWEKGKTTKKLPNR